MNVIGVADADALRFAGMCVCAVSPYVLGDLPFSVVRRRQIIESTAGGVGRGGTTVSTPTPATDTPPRECVAEATMRGGFNSSLECVEIQ